MNFRYTNTKIAQIAIVATLTLASTASSATAGEYAVVVNSANGFAGSEAENKQQIRRIFLKEQSSWPDKSPAAPFGQEAGSPGHAAFLAQVLSMSQSQFEAHWLRLKQTVGETPPREVGSTRILLRLIGRQPGGLGVVEVSQLEGAPPEVKVLFTFSD